MSSSGDFGKESRELIQKLQREAMNKREMKKVDLSFIEPGLIKYHKTIGLSPNQGQSVIMYLVDVGCSIKRDSSKSTSTNMADTGKEVK